MSKGPVVFAGYAVPGPINLSPERSVDYTRAWRRTPGVPDGPQGAALRARVEF